MGEISTCVNFAEVSGNKFVGGILGAQTFADVCECINYGKVSGESVVGGIAGSGREYLKSVNFNYGVVTATTSEYGDILGTIETDGTSPS